MSNEVRIILAHPVEWTKDETVTELVLRPNARFYKDVTVTAGENGLTFNPYVMACVGVRMAGRPAAPAFVDKMNPVDMAEVAGAVMSFLNPSQKTGTEP